MDGVPVGIRMSFYREDRLPILPSSVGPTVVVIAPKDVPVQVRAANAPVLRFESSEEFEQWSRGASERVEAAVYAALAEGDIELASCSPRTQEIIARLCERPTIPSVKELFASCSSRRSCYRSWSDDIPVTPAEFLTRVRLRHLRASIGQNGAAGPGADAWHNMAHRAAPPL
jgi:hypothetical protein